VRGSLLATEQAARSNAPSATPSIDLLKEIPIKKPVEIPNTIICHQCNKSGTGISQTSFLLSNTVNDTYPRLQKQSSDLIKCDYCPLHWHIDCLTPPLSSVPHELLDNAVEWVDQGEVAILKSQLWGGKSPLDPRPVLNPQVPMPHDVLSCQDMYALADAAIGSPILATYRCLNIRRKWMCPCHADWITPKLKARDVKNYNTEIPDRPVTWIGTHDELLTSSTSNSGQTKLKFKIKYNETIDISRNNGHIEIANQPSTMAFYAPPKTIIPERQVQYDFLERIRPRHHRGKLSVGSDIFSKLQEFDAGYRSGLESTPEVHVDHQAEVEAVMATENLSAETSDVRLTNCSL
jgi:hypothetical protein